MVHASWLVSQVYASMVTACWIHSQIYLKPSSARIITHQVAEITRGHNLTICCHDDLRLQRFCTDLDGISGEIKG